METRDLEADARRVVRAAALLARPGAFLEPAPLGYRVRSGPDRRRPALLALDETVFRALARDHGLAVRPQGGWSLSRAGAGRTPDRRPDRMQPGRPGLVLGERQVPAEDGGLVTHRANLGHCPIAWLARRTDAAGRPYLSRAEAAAGERLRDAFHRAGGVGRLTVDLDAGPRGGRGDGLDAAERAVAARAGLRRALDSLDPAHRPMVEKVCLESLSLQSAELALRLPSRSGKWRLKAGLARLAAHYGLG